MGRSVLEVERKGPGPPAVSTLVMYGFESGLPATRKINRLNWDSVAVESAGPALGQATSQRSLLAVGDISGDPRLAGWRPGHASSAAAVDGHSYSVRGRAHDPEQLLAHRSPGSERQLRPTPVTRSCHSVLSLGPRTLTLERLDSRSACVVPDEYVGGSADNVITSRAAIVPELWGALALPELSIPDSMGAGRAANLAFPFSARSPLRQI